MNPPQPDQATLERLRAELLERARLPRRLLCIDVGARAGMSQAFMCLRPQVQIVGFEPDAAECARLNAANADPALRYVPIGLSEHGGPRRLFETAAPGCSSNYPPLPPLYQHHPTLKQELSPVGESLIDTTTLDAFLAAEALPPPVALKLDTQGSELDILRGAQQALATVWMIDIEVEFNPLYQGQPLFWEVDAFLRSHGFVLWRLPLLAHYALRPVHTPQDGITVVTTPPGVHLRAQPGHGQLFWAQAHYVRQSLVQPESAPLQRHALLAAAALVSAHGHWDLALHILSRHPDTRPEAARVAHTLEARQP